MKTRNRNLLLAAAGVALIGVAGVAGTFAYLQDDTEDVVNTFSPNSVTVELSESDKDGEPTTTGRNDYSIVPGTTAEKDPKVTVTATLDSYVFVKVSGNVSHDGVQLVEYEVDGTIWKPLSGYKDVYYCEVNSEQNENDEQSFYILKDNKVAYPATLTNEDMAEGISLEFKAYAIQKVPFGEDEEGKEIEGGEEKAYLAAIGVMADNYIEVDEETTLADAVEEAEAGAAIVLKEDVVLDQELKINKNLTIVGNGDATISGKPITTTADVTFKNVTLEKPTSDKSNASLIYGRPGTKELVFDGCTFANPQWDAMQVTANDLQSLVVTNCEFRADNVEGTNQKSNGYSYDNDPDQALRYIHVEPQNDATVIANITITNNHFYNLDKIYEDVIGIYFMDEGSSITVGGNTFDGWAEGDATGGVANKLYVGYPKRIDALTTISCWEGEETTYDF